MDVPFFAAAATAAGSTLLALTRRHPVQGLLYFLVSLLATATVFFLVGAPLVGALEIILYAGAILVLFLFVVMMFPERPEAEDPERRRPAVWKGPSALAALLLGETLFVVTRGAPAREEALRPVSAAGTGAALFGPYVLAVELASFLLLAALVAALHLGRPGERKEAA
ncbi:MAG TPA: NADH-quinone oxidoreductase subunit J [Planctomycetota bacterium]|nr:NADH-quinone oxidoreductase subunit J [Planctomycetota bacterium]